MHLRKHEAARCPRCQTSLYFGTKRENTLWKVYYVCHGDGQCGWERMLGRIEVSSVSSHDEVAKRAEDMGREFAQSLN